jgi:hypothetical protein
LEGIEELGRFDVPKTFKTENLFSKVASIGLDKDQTTILRQSFLEQYNEDYSLHRLDFNFTPLLNTAFGSWRIMDINIVFCINPQIEATDVFPQTNWESENLTVGDHVYLNAKGRYKSRARLESAINIGVAKAEIKPGEGDTEIIHGRDYFYRIQYETKIPTVEGYALSDGFGWRLRGTYEKYIDCGTKRLAAILLVPKELKEATITGTITCGITNKDRRDPEYPLNKDLKYGVATINATPLVFGS